MSFVSSPMMSPGSTEQSSDNPRSPWREEIVFWLGSGVATWLLCFYFLAQTPLALVSPGKIVTDLGGSLPGLAGAAVLTLCAVGALVGLARFTTHQSTVARVVPLWVLVATYFAPLCVTSLIGGSPSTRLNAMAVVSAVATGLIAALLTRTKYVAFVLSFLTLAQAVVTVYLYKNGLNLLVSGQVNRAGGSFNQPVQVYTLMMVAFPITVMAALNSRAAVTKTFHLLAAAGQFACLILAGYRVGVLGLIGTLLFLIWHYTKSKRLLVVTACAGILLFSVFTHHRQSGPVNAASVARSDASRPLLWKKGWEVFTGSPLTGVGVGALAIPTTTPTETPDTFVTQLNPEPKNLPLFFLCEMGIFGGVLFGLSVASVYAYLKGPVRWSPLAIGVGASWLSLMIAGMFDTPFGPAERYIGNSLFGLLLGITARLNDRAVAPPQEVETHV